jgi:shikimate kinase
MGNIYILGFMGSGKTSVGKRLAEKLDKRFVDLDEAIEQKEGMSISDIFIKKGEDYFRKIEKEVIGEIAKEKDIVVSTGGGVVLDSNNFEVMKKSGITVSLLASPEVVYERVKDSNLRPLLEVEDPMGEIKKLLFERAHFYIKSDIIVDTSDLSIEEAADDILEEMNA